MDGIFNHDPKVMKYSKERNPAPEMYKNHISTKKKGIGQKIPM